MLVNAFERCGIDMGELLQGWGTGEQLGSGDDFSGLFPRLFPRFALDAHGRLRTSMHCKLLILQRKRAFAGSQRTPLGWRELNPRPPLVLRGF